MCGRSLTGMPGPSSATLMHARSPSCQVRTPTLALPDKTALWCHTQRARGPIRREQAIQRCLYDSVAQFSLCGEGEIESAQVGGSGVLQECAGPPGVEADEVDRGRSEGVFEGDFAGAGVVGLADVGDCGGLVDGAFDSGPSPVGLFPGVGLCSAWALRRDSCWWRGRSLSCRRRCCERVQ